MKHPPSRPDGNLTPSANPNLWRRMMRELRQEFSHSSRDSGADDFDDEANALAVGGNCVGIADRRFFSGEIPA